MYRFKKLLVALDLSPKDESLIRYVRHLSGLAGSERIYFVHVAEHFDIPDQIRNEYPDLLEPFDEFTNKKMKSMIEEQFSGEYRSKVNLEVSEGEPISGILHTIRNEDIDLVIVGKPDPGPGKHNIAEKLARKAPCSVLVIPEGSKTGYERIMLATDFSDHAEDALDVATAFAKAEGIDSIDGIHVFSLPLGYYKTGKSEQEFTDIMQKNALSQYEDWIKGQDLKDIHIRFESVRGKKTEQTILEKIREKDSDLLVVATRGRSTGAAILLGSITEELIGRSHIPILAVKRKGTGMDLLEAILSA